MVLYLYKEVLMCKRTAKFTTCFFIVFLLFFIVNSYDVKAYKKYNEITKDKISFFISHRLSSTVFCDRILFISNGRITESGTHEELMALKGAYYRMYQSQSYYYKEMNVNYE